jgi:hypothetical protein
MQLPRFLTTRPPTNKPDSAVLPESFIEPSIKDTKIGQTFYTLPWGMWVDLNRMCWLHPDYPVSPEPDGTLSMRVQRRADGFHVWPPATSSYSPTAAPGYVSPADTVYLAVAKLHV